MASAPLPTSITRTPFPFPSHLPTSSARRLSPPFSFPFPRFPTPVPSPPPPDDRNLPIGDCIVFDEDAFEPSNDLSPPPDKAPSRPESLVPEKWRHAVAEINIDKKERRRMAHELKFGSRIERRRRGSVVAEPPAVLKSEEYLAFREKKMRQLKPVVLDDPVVFAEPPREEEIGEAYGRGSLVERAMPMSPRKEVEGFSLESISEYFNSGDYVPGAGADDDKKPRSSRRLFSQEEKILLNKRVPNLSNAASKKWLPLHTLAASGEFDLMDALLKYDVDINAVDSDGLTAIHKAILGKKQAILNYLLRESANPFVCDYDGATLMHYAVQTASSLAIKTLLLYNVDINQPDNDGWTPLHLAVQTQRTDIVKLLLIKGADMTMRNKDGLTPLDLCLYSGRSENTYEIIKLLKKLPKTS